MRPTYSYDAAGIKLAQKVYNASDSLLKKTDYLGEFVFENDTLQFIQHDEGRISISRKYDFYNGEFDEELTYQYHLTDHLGNTRMTIQPRDTVVYFATMEEVLGATRMEEDSLFHNIYTADRNFPSLNHTSAVTATPSPEFSSFLNGIESVIGPAKMIHVVPGDKIQAETYVRYLDQTTYGDPIALEYLANLLSNTFISGAGENATQMAAGFEDIVTGHPFGSTVFTDKPRAFLNYILFDKDHNFVDMGAEELSSAGKYTDPTIGTHGYLTFDQEIEIDQAGYIYIYLSNETWNSEVYFDDLKITHTKSPIVQKDDYYPFGLTFGGAGYQRQGETENKFRFQNQEHQDDLDLGWVQFKWRNHDPAIGRFFNVDPLADKYVHNSTYAFAENKVITFIELEGLEGLHYMDGNGGHVIEKNVVVLQKRTDYKPQTSSNNSPQKNARIIKQTNRKNKRNAAENKRNLRNVTDELNTYFNGSDGYAKNSANEKVTFKFNISEKQVDDPTTATRSMAEELGEGGAMAAIVTQKVTKVATTRGNFDISQEHDENNQVLPGSIAHEVGHTLMTRGTQNAEESKAGKRSLMVRSVGGVGGSVSKTEVDKMLEDAIPHPNK